MGKSDKGSRKSDKKYWEKVTKKLKSEKKCRAILVINFEPEKQKVAGRREDNTWFKYVRKCSLRSDLILFGQNNHMSVSMTQQFSEDFL